MYSAGGITPRTPSTPKAPLTYEMDPNVLFVKHSIPELRVLEQQYRSIIESKKQELRLMVGERYRDLIDAADSITTMREAALDVQVMFKRMSDGCDVSSLRRRVADEMKKGSGSDKDDSAKRALFTAAAHIKLLVDIPEQIYHALEQNSYLSAARLYLIARNVYRNLRTLRVPGEKRGGLVTTRFPVVQRQWDAVSHFKTQIVQQALAYLAVVDASEQAVTNTLGALLLLNGADKADCLTCLLSARRSAIEALISPSTTLPSSSTHSSTPASTVSKSNKGSELSISSTRNRSSFTTTLPSASNLAEQSSNGRMAANPITAGEMEELTKLADKLLGMVHILRRTIEQVDQIFLSTENTEAGGEGVSRGALFDSLVATLQRGISVHEHLFHNQNEDTVSTKPMDQGTAPPRAIANTLPFQTVNTNFHLLIRYLPENSQSFIPNIRTGGTSSLRDGPSPGKTKSPATAISSSSSFSAMQVKQTVQAWIRDVTRVVLEGAQTVLNSMAGSDAQQSADLGSQGGCRRVVETRNIVWRAMNSQSSNGDRWNEICNRLLGSPLPLYSTFLRQPFNSKFQHYISTAFDAIASQSSEGIRRFSEELCGKEGFDEDVDLARFVWETTTGMGNGPTERAGKDLGAIEDGIEDLSGLSSFQSMIFRTLRSETDRVSAAGKRLDQAFERLKMDVEGLVSTKVNSGMKEVEGDSTEGDDETHEKSDAEHLRIYLLDECVRAMGVYADGLEKIITNYKTELTESATTNPEINPSPVDGRLPPPLLVPHPKPVPPKAHLIEKILLIGRIAKSVSGRCDNGFGGIFSVGPGAYPSTSVYTKDGRRRYSSLGVNPDFSAVRRRSSSTSTRGVPNVGVDPRLGLMRDRFTSIYIGAHDSFTDAIATEFGSELQIALRGREPDESVETKSSGWVWGDACPLLNSWEAFTIDEKNETGETVGSNVQLPGNLSGGISRGLWRICDEMYRISGCGLDRTIVISLLRNLSQISVSAYMDFLNRHLDHHGDSQNSDPFPKGTVTEKGALQLLFDVLFLMKIFDVDENGSVDVKENWKNDVLKRIREKIDPIDLMTFEHLIVANVERSYNRTAVLYGAITGAAAKPNSRKPVPSSMRSRSSSSVQEVHNIIPVATQVPRFQLLPIGQPMPSWTGFAASSPIMMSSTSTRGRRAGSFATAYMENAAGQGR